MSNPPKTGKMLMDWDRPRLLEFIRFLEANDGVLVGRTIAELIKELHWGQGPFQRTVEAAEAYGIIRVTRTGLPGFGLGRVPNRYELLIPYDQWIATGAAIVADWRRSDATVPRLRKRAIKREARERDIEEGSLAGHTLYSTLPAPPPGGAWLEVRGDGRVRPARVVELDSGGSFRPRTSGSVAASRPWW